MTVFPEGTKAMLDVLELGEIMQLIERTARWVDPETFRLLPVWYPEHARRAQLYDASWSQPRQNTNKITGVTSNKLEGNTQANKALTHALGLNSKQRKNWTCCHIWGVDDPSFQSTNVIVQDHRFFSCVANMVLLPTPLKAFTDTMTDVKTMLRICSSNLYGWRCDHEAMKIVSRDIDEWKNWDDYPKSWPRRKGSAHPPGIMKINDKIRKRISNRRKKINDDLQHSGSHYPKKEVLQALAYWELDIEQDAAN